ncbi:DNA gyrase subunit A [Candidatus Dependentiae bacterium]|nr:DNA gyrase subunit A [Candidatus Dependentiae bacterium]
MDIEKDKNFDNNNKLNYNDVKIEDSNVNHVQENDENPNVKTSFIEDELKYSYIDYSMSVIIGRALPDARDGLKPVHRRILYAMNDMSLSYNKAYRKSARIVGEVLGKYHPHGDTAVYDAMVRMVQQFSLRYPLVDGQGNFGSVDGDNAAAMRYTEARMKRIANELLNDIDKETVDFIPNFDESLVEPTVLPAALPNLLLNGSSGIAVGMATNIPPHNIIEVCNAIISQIDNPDIKISDLIKIISGPDFPTGGIIYGRRGIVDMYETGRGKILVRGKTKIEESKHSANKQCIIVNEIPYQVNKTSLIKQIASLVHEGIIEGISDLRDESDRDGMRIVIELKRNENPEIILNQLFKHTMLQTTFGVIMLAIVENKPKVLNLKELNNCYIEHRIEVIIRRTKYELRKAEERAHILEGYKIALANLDEVIETIKKSKTPEIAKTGLMTKFLLSEIQALAVLKMQLQRLTGLEIEKIEQEYKEVIELIKKLKEILASRQLILNIIKEDLSRIITEYGDARKTEITENLGEFDIEDLIADEEMVLTVTHKGYIKRTATSIYKAQHRGGRGLYGMDTKDDDFVSQMFIASTHNYILFFTNSGKVHWLKVYQIPEGERRSRGKAIVNLLELAETEKITAYIPVKVFDDNSYLIMLTKGGIIKKTFLSAYSHPRKGGIQAITLKENDTLIDVKLTDGQSQIVIGTLNGQAIRFDEKRVRSVGRTSMGVTGIRLDTKNNDYVIGMVVVKDDDTILTATENGFGKRTDINEYRLTNRGGKGIINIKTSDRNGKVVSILNVRDTDELMIMTKQGMIIRQKVSELRCIGRNTQGVRLIKLEENDLLIDIAAVAESEEEIIETNENGTVEEKEKTKLNEEK